MKKMISFLDYSFSFGSLRILLPFFLLLLISCNSDDCSATKLRVASLEEEFGCPETKFQMEIDLSEDFIIIRSQDEFEDLVNISGCEPNIDFSKSDLLIGKKVLYSGNSSIEYDLHRACTGNLNLQITFHQNMAAVVLDLTYHALIPKLGPTESVDVEFSIE